VNISKSRDGRSLSHATLAEIRERAVERVVRDGESPEVVIRALGFHRSVIYEWLGRFRRGGMAALEAKPVPGRPAKLGATEMQRLVHTITSKNPLQLRFPFALWTRSMIQELIWREFGVSLSESAVGRMLRRLGLSPQRPLFRAYQQDPQAVQRWREEEYPAIQKLAKAEGAVICFGDEAGIRSDHHSGTNWAPQGQTPVVRTTGSRFGMNLISAVSAKGQLRFMVTPDRMTALVFVEFLRRLIHNQERPVFLIVDNHSTHRARIVKDFVEKNSKRLRLFYLPSNSPELNPDEWVWRHVKNHRVGRQVITGPLQFRQQVLTALHRLQKLTSVIRGFFYDPDIRYAL
jgi:transposase